MKTFLEQPIVNLLVYMLDSENFFPVRKQTRNGAVRCIHTKHFQPLISSY